MNIQNAIDIILKQNEYKGARGLLDSNKEETKACLLKRIEERITPDFKSDNNEEIILLLNLSAEYSVNAFDVYYHFLCDNSINGDEKRRIIIDSPAFTIAFANSITNPEELKLLQDQFFCENTSDNRQFIIVKVVLTYLSHPLREDEMKDPDLSQTLQRRNKCLVDYFSKVINWINNYYKLSISTHSEKHEDTNRHTELFQILHLITVYYYNNEYQMSFNTISLLSSVIVQIIVASKINDRLFKWYFRLLKLLSPQTYCEALHISDYIRNMRKTLYKENIFKASTLEKVGQILYHKIQDDTECSEQILKLAIQIIHRYPLNKRNKPVKEEEYYEEITAYLDINIVPSESLTVAKNQYNKVRAELMLLIDRIRELEKKCDEKREESKAKSDDLKLKNGRNYRFDDTTSIRKALLIEIQKYKEFESLYRKKESLTDAEETGADSYLEYCINYLNNTFAIFIEDGKTKEEIDETLKQWALMDASRNPESTIAESAFSIEERFTPYFNIIEQFNMLIDDEPSMTLKRMRLRIKTYLFAKDITDKHQKASGSKLADHSSNEYKKYIKELNSHPFSLEKTICITDASEYLKRQKKVVAEAINRIMTNIDQSICLQKRKEVIEEIVSLFKNKKYATVINMIPIQIEGLFADYLEMSLIYKSGSDLNLFEQIYKSVFMTKAKMAETNDLNLGFETIGYFRYYFNSVFRNTVAHGNYWILFSDYTESEHIDDKKASMILAHDLILDLNYIIDVVVNSNEIDEAKRYLEYTAASLGDLDSYDTTTKTCEGEIDDEELELKELDRLDSRYQRLYLDLLGESRFNIGNYKKGIFISYDPDQLLFWIFNPLIESVIDGSACIEIRKVLLSQEFWSYVIQKLQRGVILNDITTLDKVVDHLMPKFKEDKPLHKLAIEVKKTIKHLKS